VFSRWEHRLFFLLIATMAWSGAMRLELARLASNDFHKPAECSYFSGQPILDIELASSPACFLRVTLQGSAANLRRNSQLFRANTYMDFVFIGLYWAVFVLFAQVEEGRWSRWVIGFISVSAMCDILENTRILKELSDVLVSGQAQGLLARPVSLTKWTALSIALGCLGTLVWPRAERGSRLLGVAMFAAGILTLAGLLVPKAMTFGVYCFVLVLLLSVARFWPYSLESVLLGVEYAYLMRFQVLAALLLAIGLPVTYWVIPSVFVGLFDGRGFWSFAFIVWAAFQLAWTIMVTCRLVLVYGPARFIRAKSIEVPLESDGQTKQTVEPAQSVQPLRASTVVGFGVLALPVVIVLFLGSPEPSTFGKGVAVLLGLIVAGTVLVVTASLHFSIEDKKGKTAESVFPSFGFLEKKAQPEQSGFWKFVATSLARLGPDLTAGILDGARLRSGHEMAAIALGVFLFLYVVVGAFFSPSWSTPEHQPAAMFFLLFLLTMFTWFFSGAAFFLDRTRLPVFTTLLAVSLLTGFVGTDHEFSVKETATRDAGRLGPSEVVRSWESGKRRKNSKTVTIVATAGGGIRAAAWTAEVMTRLQEHCSRLSSSVLLVSSVSGGSVGSMFVVGPYSSENGDYPVQDAELQAIRFNASRSSLSAVGWGLAYPDLARTVPIAGSLIKQTVDRGWSLENAWATAWRDAHQEAPFMSRWREDVRNGTRPAVIFNATVSESGERFLVASTDTDSKGSKQFFDLFPQADIRVATAARLSATFPYVSPLARPSAGSLTNAYHVGDGGYYDNSGLLSAVEWLRDAADAIQDRQVLLVLIDAKPDDPKTGSSWPWQKQLVGPLETLLHVRSSSQQLRDSIELKMAVDYLAAQKVKVTVTPVSFLFSSDSAAPLSWHLTQHQLDEIGSSWADPQNIKSANLAYQALGCSADTR
jgi:hypothetical protein